MPVFKREYIFYKSGKDKADRRIASYLTELSNLTDAKNDDFLFHHQRLFSTGGER
jgi:hypothetical protein